MNLYPQDLRDVLHAVVVRRRSYGTSGSNTPVASRPFPQPPLGADLPAKHIGWWGRLWTRGLELTPQEAKTGLPALSRSIGSSYLMITTFAFLPFVITGMELFGNHAPSDWAYFGGSAVFGTIATGMTASIIHLGIRRQLYKTPLSVSEVSTLLPSAQDNTDRAYIELIREAVKQPVPRSTEHSLRDTLRALGRAIDTLPPPAPAPQDTHALRQNAAAIRAQAEVEQDTVIAASETRQADALERQAAALDRSVTLTRRTQVLRAELLAQIDALRASLTDFRPETPTDTALLEALSEDIQRVAEEASHVAQARSELETFIAPPIRSPDTANSTVLRVGRQ